MNSPLDDPTLRAIYSGIVLEQAHNKGSMYQNGFVDGMCQAFHSGCTARGIESEPWLREAMKTAKTFLSNHAEHVRRMHEMEE